jgi:DNA gyrase/topoisomerase IV subunit B
VISTNQLSFSRSKTSKGLGEMSPRGLLDTTMDPTRRKLLKVTEKNYDPLAVFEKNMADKVQVRKKKP